MEAYMWAIWLGIFVLALIIEATTESIVSIWFAVAGIIATIVSVIPNVAWWIQLIIFLVVSIASLLALRPIVKKYMKVNKVETNVDEMINKKGIMVKKYDQFNPGEVKINGVIWTAINIKEEEPIDEGDVVSIVSIKGNKLKVKMINKGEN